MNDNEMTIEKMHKIAELEGRVSAEVLKRLQAEPGNEGLRNVHFSLGPTALNMDFNDLVEQIIEYHSAGRKARQEWDAKPEAEKLLEYLESTYVALDEIIDLCKSSSAEWRDGNKDLLALKSEIFGIVEGTMLPLNRTETFDPRKVRVKK